MFCRSSKRFSLGRLSHQVFRRCCNINSNQGVSGASREAIVLWENTKFSNKTKQCLLTWRYLPIDLCSFHILHLAHLASVRLQIDVLLQKQYVIDLMLSPNAIATVGIMDTRQIMKILRSYLGGRYAELKMEPPLRCTPNANRIQFFLFAIDIMQRMTAAGVRVAIRKGYLCIAICTRNVHEYTKYAR